MFVNYQRLFCVHSLLDLFKITKSFHTSCLKLGELSNASIDAYSLYKCQMEFNSGAGGVEAALFTSELIEMYRRFSESNGWRWIPFEIDRIKSSTTGVRSAIISIEGECCYAKLRFEGGVHRVQRTPITDKTRIHTSTSSIAILPEPETPELFISPADLHREIMRASGPGGANVNAKSTAVRLTHIPTGISVKAQDERYLEMNEKLAHKRLSAILLKRQIDQINSKYSGSRKLQVGSQERSEKIRTFNYKDNKVIDHRLKHSIGGVHEFLEGGDKLEEMIEMLMEMSLEEEQEENNTQTRECSILQKLPTKMSKEVFDNSYLSHLNR
ncbi:PCRF domain-containing protein [Meloidogyne graminicola]|uniref:PCRF domain-containing protein n=1 Tax=Meloidogyne graminicola TaxID=189291 RepID=A0A8S9ZUY2_9BILA|nr:PCRF domain-containing protein [Meloidogyne graminicola]